MIMSTQITGGPGYSRAWLDVTMVTPLSWPIR